MSNPISIAAFARLRKVSVDTVKQYIEEGKLDKAIVRNPKTGHRKIDPVAAEAELAANTDSSNTHSAENGRRSSSKPPQERPKEAERERDDGGLSYIELKKKREAVKLQQEAIRLRIMKGELVEKESVHNVLFAFGKQVRDSITSVPDQIVDSLMACRTRTEAHKMLTDALEDALRELSSAGELRFPNKRGN